MENEKMLLGVALVGGAALLLKTKSKTSVSGIAGEFSSNKKLENVLSQIKEQLLSIHDTPEESIDEVKHYMREFPREPDYNLYQYGNVLMYNDEIRDLYSDYESLKNASDNKLVEIYKRQVGAVARKLVK